MREETDEVLIEGAKLGDHRALEVLIQRYQGKILRFGMKMCGNEDDARDVVQETLIAAARTIRNFRGDSAPSTWLYTIARSFCIKHRRKSKFAPTHEESIEQEALAEVRSIADPGRGPEQKVADRELAKTIDLAISNLDPMYKEVLVLRDVEGLSAAEVAKVLDLTVAAVKSRLHRARSMVREMVAPFFEQPAISMQPGATCPDIANLFSRNLEGEISVELCADMQRHLDSCPRCQHVCDSLNEVLATCKTSPSPSVPDDLQARVRAEVVKVFG